MMKLIFLTLVSLTSFVCAHFTLDYPPARGFDEDKLGSFPCGGQDTVTTNRTSWPLAGGPIQLTMGHDHAAVQVLIALGTNVTNNFNAILVPTTQEEGLGKFCLSDVKVPESLGVKEGDNATIQVVTNGDPSGGLYNCADITFSSTNSSAQECTNGKGVTTTKYTGKSANANATDSMGPSSTASASSGTGKPTATGSSTSTSSTGAAGKLEFVGSTLFAACLVKVMTLLW